MIKIGRPEYFFSNFDVRLMQLTNAYERFKFIRLQIYNMLKDHILGTIYIKGLGNQPDLISCFRELLFNARELLDSLLYQLHIFTQQKTNKNFMKFFPKLINGEYDYLSLEIINHLKFNCNYIFHIRKLRNEIKNNIGNINFIFATDHIEARLIAPLSPDEIKFIDYLEIEDKNDVIQNKSYSITVNLDEYFPEMINFWNIIKTQMIKK